MTEPQRAAAIACLGAGRMGRGIAVVFAYAGHRGDAGRLQAAQRGGLSQRSRPKRSARSATRSTSLARFGLFDRGQGRHASSRASRSCREAQAGRALAGRRDLSKACRRCSTSSARCWRARPRSRARSRSSPRPPRPFWSTTSRARSRTRSASSTRIGSIRPIWCRWSSCRPARDTDPAVTARLKALLEGIGKVPVVCARAARLHRAAHPGARHERGRAHGRGRRRQRRGHRQGDQVRLRLPLRRARHAGVHRLGRRRHSLLRQPLSHQGARTTSAMPRPRSSSATCGKAISA